MLERRGHETARSRDRSGSPVALVLVLYDVKHPVEVARLLRKRGLSLRKAHETLNLLANGETVSVDLYADTWDQLISELRALGVRARINCG
jgi:hypothetical protein